MPSEADLSLWARPWGASAAPFGLGKAQDWLESPSAHKALASLNQTAQLRSVWLLAGPTGVGKSALVSRWMRALANRFCGPLCLTQATLGGTAILATLATTLGKPASDYRQRNLHLLEEALGELDRPILVVILDEGQNSRQPRLEEVRRLLGLNRPEQPAFALVLIGDEYLLASLQLRNPRALYARLAGQVSLAPWTMAQCLQDLGAALSAGGLSNGRGEPAAAELLARASAGLPRRLCLLARAAWLAAATAPAQKISPEPVPLALQQVPCVPGLLPPSPSPET
jgi:type II secretory pathway predicted ATPase ExeA